MKGAKRVKTKENDLPDDPDLERLFAFIAESLSGDNARKRSVLTDEEYSFTIRTTSLSGDIEDHVVRIEARQTLYFYRSGTKDETNTRAFMVDEEDHAWYVDGKTGQVKHFKDNHFSGRISRGLHEKNRQDGTSLGLG